MLVAQAALETGWGKSIMRQQDGSSSHNLFGIKAAGSWKGAEARAITSEFRDGKMVKETADFRSYDSYADSFHDWSVCCRTTAGIKKWSIRPINRNSL